MSLCGFSPHGAVYLFILILSNLCFTEGLLLYTILLFSIKYQQESDTYIHVPIPFEPPSLLPRPTPLD